MVLERILPLCNRLRVMSSLLSFLRVVIDLDNSSSDIRFSEMLSSLN